MSRLCIALFSGGLDSALALRLVASLGVDVVAVHCRHAFHAVKDPEQAAEALRRRALELGAKDILFPDVADDLAALVKRPRYGLGKNMNPCLDCRLLTISQGKRAMDELGGDFLASGEVLGQRPMSQRRDAMNTVDRHVRDMGIPGRLLRPLSALLLPPTFPETEGWIDREKLMGIGGRGRKPQLELAARLGVKDYPNPAGGCLLTDPGYAARLRDLHTNEPDWTPADAELLKIGRHFWFGRTRVVASRNDEENGRLRVLARPDDRFYLAAERPGAVVLSRGAALEESERAAAGLALHYSKMRDAGEADVFVWRGATPDVRETLRRVALDPSDIGVKIE